MKFNPSNLVRSRQILFDITLRDLDVDEDRATSVALTGWITSDSLRIETIEVWCDGLVIAYGFVTMERPDVVAHFYPKLVKTECGFHMRFSKLLLGKDARLEIRAVSRNPDNLLSRHVLGDITDLPRLSIDWKITPQITPILVVGMGRSGTSAFMETLSGHPEIIVPGKFPYELRQFSYLCQSAYILTSPSDYNRSTKPDEFEMSEATIGFNPFLNREWEKFYGSPRLTQWQDREFPEEFINFIIGQIDKMTITCPVPPKPRARFIAEKFSISPLRRVVENLYPGRREIFLVRDFRDVYLSARQMNAKRGTTGFGQSKFDTDLERLRGLSWSVRQMRLAYIATEPRPLLIRYEDFVTDRGHCIDNILSYLGLREDLEFNEHLTLALSKDVNNSAHMTSKSVTDSIGRWKTEMTDEEKQISQEAFGEELAYFGY